MAIVSPQKNALASLASLAERPTERFDPTLIEGMQGEGSDQTPLFLKGTVAFPTVPKLGNLTVAVYSTQGPAIETEGTDEVVHRGCDVAALLVPLKGHVAQLQLLEPISGQEAGASMLAPTAYTTTYENNIL